MSLDIIKAIILGIVEGLTEFLPVSSTGHLILTNALLPNTGNKEFWETFEIVIQLAAILAVVVLYFKRFIHGFEIYKKLLLAFIPTGILGFIYAHFHMKEFLFNPAVVSSSLIVGGVILIMLDKWSAKKESKYASLEAIPASSAMKIGLIQSISMIPGVSRAAATILGGIYNGFNRRQATEFSFLLAVPTMFVASGYELWKAKDNLDKSHINLLLIGSLVAFVFAMLAVKGFINFLVKYGFKGFGYYRIIIGVLALILFYYFNFRFEK